MVHRKSLEAENFTDFKVLSTTEVKCFLHIFPIVFDSFKSSNSMCNCECFATTGWVFQHMQSILPLNIPHIQSIM